MRIQELGRVANIFWEVAKAVSYLGGTGACPPEKKRK